ncbi:MAG: hypothetical protein LUH08_00985, partial [Ruminococcus sp.]|nr:hypothetical protein [Ruminococcus sp.]
SSFSSSVKTQRSAVFIPLIFTFSYFIASLKNLLKFLSGILLPEKTQVILVLKTKRDCKRDKNKKIPHR